MNPIIIDAQVFAQLGLEQCVEEQTVEIVPFEIDAVHDRDFGNLYRLWQGWNELLVLFT
jgi:hypothetical protein